MSLNHLFKTPHEYVSPKEFMDHRREEEWTKHYKICTGYSIANPEDRFALIDLKTCLSLSKQYPSLESARRAAIEILLTGLIEEELQDVAKN